jgi:hypothetical protein
MKYRIALLLIFNATAPAPASHRSEGMRKIYTNMIRKKSATCNHTAISPAPGFTPREVRLMHPTLNVPAVATSTSYYRSHAGRAIGLVLVFADGHTASLTYAEIGQLSDALTPRVSTVPAGYTFMDANAELFS